MLHTGSEIHTHTYCSVRQAVATVIQDEPFHQIEQFLFQLHEWERKIKETNTYARKILLNKFTF